MILTAAGAAVVVLLTVLVETAWGPLERLDAAVAEDCRHWVAADPARERTLLILSDWVWDPFAFRGVVLAVCVWLWWRRGGRSRLPQVLWAAVALLVAVGLSGSAKVVFDRPRPEGMAVTAPGGSFPSGHVLTATAAVGVLVVLLRPHLSARGRPWLYAGAAVSAIGVGATRVLLGAHFLSDVVAGWILGGVVLAVTLAVFRWRGADPAEPYD
ncbi:phosphatase PAP2 family protein [Yinghuangia soli]|uniref:Phosphatase PAP2 family protein n=1 Tax=Yinghuangia soli TaxID=2908204 RepID=A0AA41TYJ4_9ACTN|nr:phosphatase PAP2 family protein [Yinghuangia soli]MCF2526245.1 phosphatase PAP2 family protein [Yinghuangia soli]